jgi:hypothetical protein
MPFWILAIALYRQGNLQFTCTLTTVIGVKWHVPIEGPHMATLVTELRARLAIR